MGDSNEPIVRVKDLSVVFNDIKLGLLALDSVSFNVMEGEFISIIGPSGCGKSTLFKLLADLIETDGVNADVTGSVEVLGHSPEYARMNRKIGVVFQKPTLLEWRDINSNIALPLEIMGVSKQEIKVRVKELLSLIGLNRYGEFRPSQLSGGMQQRVSIARALAYDPDILLMDEPFSALDEIKRRDMNDSLLDIWKKTSKTIMFVTHSIQEAVYLSQRIIILSDRPGRVKDTIDINIGYPRSKFLDSDQYFEHQNKVRHILSK